LDLYGQAPPGGESYADLAKRVLPAFEAVVAETAGAGKIAIVAHRAVIQSILARGRGLPGPMAPGIGIGHGERVVFTHESVSV
jgi:broad specificity phosphatase PhoE